MKAELKKPDALKGYRIEFTDISDEDRINIRSLMNMQYPDSVDPVWRSANPFLQSDYDDFMMIEFHHTDAEKLFLATKHAASKLGTSIDATPFFERKATPSQRYPDFYFHQAKSLVKNLKLNEDSSIWINLAANSIIEGEKTVDQAIARVKSDLEVDDSFIEKNHIDEFLERVRNLYCIATPPSIMDTLEDMANKSTPRPHM